MARKDLTKKYLVKFNRRYGPGSITGTSLPDIIDRSYEIKDIASGKLKVFKHIGSMPVRGAILAEDIITVTKKSLLSKNKLKLKKYRSKS